MAAPIPKPIATPISSATAAAAIARLAIPGSLRLIQRFLNTHNHELPPDADRLGTPDRAAEWLVASGLLEPGHRLTEPDRRRLVAIREALRTVVTRAGSRGPALTASAVPVGVRFEDGGQPSLVALGPGVQGAISGILAAVAEASLSGSWTRLKACRECRWAFYDRSKDRSGVWCAMRICGNRTKNRSYRRRRGASPGTPGDAPRSTSFTRRRS